MRRWLLAFALVACSKSGSDEKPADKPAPPAPTAPAKSESLGTVSFELTEGTPAARAHFNRGMAALHSFWYDEAQKEFKAAIDADASMNMAYWGAAMSRCQLLWHQDDVQAARALLSAAPALERLSPRERAWFDASVELLSGENAMAGRKRFLAAMEAINKQFPDDESATFLALALLSATMPDDPDNLAVRKRAGELAAAVFQHNPNHPGAAHYVIHAYDTPELAAQALPFARAYAKIAPTAFHAQHMPAHIFSRLGMWQDAITSCRAAWDASLASAKRDNLGADHYDIHSLNWVIEMSFELGHRKDADAALALFQNAVRSGMNHQNRGQYALQVTSYMLRTGEWNRVGELLAPLDAAATDDAPGTRPAPMANHCGPAAAGSSPAALLEQFSVVDARARAAAAQHDVAGTKQQITALDAVLAKLHPFFEASQPKEAVAKMDKFDDRRRRVLRARASGDDKALLAVLREAAAVADKEPTGGENNPVGLMLHEEIADVLMRLGQPGQALEQLDGVLHEQPGRARSLLASARARAKTGDAAGARARYQQLVDQWASADPGTPGLDEAKAALAAK